MATQQNRMPPGRKSVIIVAGSALVAASPFLMHFLQKWESGKKVVLTVYADRLAQNIPTVCNGLTRHVTKTPIIVGEKWTTEKCELEEAIAVIKAQEQLAKCFKIAPPQVVFDMATSHGWNNGVANTCGSQAMAAWNRAEWDKGCQYLSRSESGKYVWSSVRTGRKLSNGQPEFKFVQGLANRRADETATCYNYNLTSWSTHLPLLKTT